MKNYNFRTLFLSGLLFLPLGFEGPLPEFQDGTGSPCLAMTGCIFSARSMNPEDVKCKDRCPENSCGGVVISELPPDEKVMGCLNICQTKSGQAIYTCPTAVIWRQPPVGGTIEPTWGNCNGNTASPCAQEGCQCQVGHVAEGGSGGAPWVSCKCVP